jgi:hypothetical protein
MMATSNCKPYGQFLKADYSKGSPALYTRFHIPTADIVQLMILAPRSNVSDGRAASIFRMN